MFNKVDFPHPLGPTIVIKSLGFTSMSVLSRARIDRSPRVYDFDTDFNEMMLVFLMSDSMNHHVSNCLVTGSKRHVFKAKSDSIVFKESILFYA